MPKSKTNTKPTVGVTFTDRPFQRKNRRKPASGTACWFFQASTGVRGLPHELVGYPVACDTPTPLAKARKEAEVALADVVAETGAPFIAILPLPAEG